jgi:hypothetical protein
MRTHWPKGRLRAATVALSASAALAGIIGVSGVAQGDEPPCAPPPTAPEGEVLRIVEGLSPSGGAEHTSFLADGTYYVVRCDADGALDVAQHVGTIPAPGGTAEVPLSVAKLDRSDVVTTFMTYGDANDPNWSSYFQSVREDVEASIVPPTEEG